jgi:hypothetical protein
MTEEICKLAVQCCGNALRYVKKELRNDIGKIFNLMY